MTDYEVIWSGGGPSPFELHSRQAWHQRDLPVVGDEKDLVTWRESRKLCAPTLDAKVEDGRVIGKGKWKRVRCRNCGRSRSIVRVDLDRKRCDLCRSEA